MSAPVRKLLDQWGREVDQASWSWGKHLPPQENPDDTTSDSYYDISQNPQVVAGMAFSDISHLFVSARGLQDDETGQYFPPQLMFTTPELAGDDIFDLVGWQFDEEFEGGFSKVIHSTDTPCKTYGHIVIEYEWYRRETQPFKGKFFVRRAYARDPEKYRYDLDGKPGIYQDTGFGSYKRMNPQNFQAYAYNPLFNNPYGQSINLPLKPWIETFNKMFGYWRHALEKAGMGSWGASCPNAWFTKDETSVAMRSATEEAIKKIAAGTWSVFPEGMTLENYKLQMEAQAFLDWYTSFCEVVSLIHTGTTGALKEEQYGSRSAKESTDVREKSQREKFNASRVSTFWTWQFIPLLVDVNFRPTQIRSYPTLQLIPPNLITATTPKDQDTAQEVTDGTSDNEEQPQEKIEVKTEQPKQQEDELMSGNFSSGQVVMLQEEEQPYTPPAVPPGYKEFPKKDPLPPEYRSAVDLARAYLEEMPVKNYPDVQKDEAFGVFTVKKLRTFRYSEDLLSELKQAIIPTLQAENEDAAWNQYWQSAVDIFREFGFEQPSPELRDSLIISFRQARQNALNEGVYQAALQDESIVGLRILNDPGVVDHHETHVLWNNIAIPKDHQELRLGGRLRIPMDFGCVCRYELIRNGWELTPESEWPKVYPGDTYRYYVSSQ